MMNATLAEWWPVLMMIVGAIASYYGASNAMRERLARSETRLDNHSELLKAHGTQIADAHSRINRLLEKERE